VAKVKLKAKRTKRQKVAKRAAKVRVVAAPASAAGARRWVIYGGDGPRTVYASASSSSIIEGIAVTHSGALKRLASK